MKKNIMDTSTDILKNRISQAYDVMRQEYKSTNPYRKQLVSARETLYQFSQFTPDMIDQARQTMGSDVVDQYLQTVDKARRRINA